MRMFHFSRNGTCAGVDLLKIIRAINPNAHALTRLIPLKTKHMHLLPYKSESNPQKNCKLVSYSLVSMFYLLRIFAYIADPYV